MSRSTLRLRVAAGRRAGQPWRRLTPVLAAALWLALAWGAPGHEAAAAEGQGAARPVLRLGYTEAAPYSSTGPAGVARGFSIELIATIADHAGYDVRFVPAGNPDAAVSALMAGEIEATTLIAITPARAARVAFTKPVLPMDIDLIARAGEKRFGSAAELSGMRVGVFAGTVAERVAGGLRAVEIVRFDTVGAMTMALLEGDVDALLSPPEPIRRTAMRAGIRDHVRVLEASLEQVQLSFAVPRDRPGLLAELNAALAALRRSGEIDALAETWFGRQWSLWRDARAGWIAAAVSSVVALLTVLVAVTAAHRSERRARRHIARVTRGRDRLAVAHSDLARSNARLAQANEQLERFANVAAHDLRAPLRALMTLPGWVREELTESGIDLPADVSGLLDDIFDQAASMDQMLKDLLDYARLGGDGAERTLFHPAERIDGIARMAGMPEEFTLEIATDMPPLELSTVEFDTVMRNLLSNSVKHHDRPNGRIRVRGWRQGPAAVLEVEDDGPGIAPEHRERIFEIFSTLGPRDKMAGGGMGLAFVRRIVEGWGGRVQVRSPDRGRGTVFRLLVPAPMPRAA